MTQFLITAFSDRRIRVLHRFILTSGCLAGDYPCPGIRFSLRHLKLNAKLNSSFKELASNRSLLPKTLCAATRIWSNVTDADKSPFDTNGQIT